MTSWQYIRASLRHYLRLHLAVAAGVAVATAVITGALLVGDSMRGSLRGLVEQGLGRIEAVLIAEHPFREAMVDGWVAAPTMKVRGARATPLILAQGSAVFRDAEGEVHRAAQLQVIGAPPEFWSFANRRAAPPVERGNQIALTSRIARELGVKRGDAVLLRLPAFSSIPADSSLGEKEETAASRRFEVAAILDEDDEATLARFSLRPSQQAPRNVFVPLATLQDLLELPAQVNAAVMAFNKSEPDGPLHPFAYLDVRHAGLIPELGDYGLKLERMPFHGPEADTSLRLSADRLVLPPEAVKVAHELYDDSGLQPVVTYLANRITAGDRTVPYSTIAGVDSTAALGPVFDENGQPIKLAEHEVALNDWTAEQLAVNVGDKVSIAWYEPETTHGRLTEPRPLELTVRAIVPLADPDGKPSAAADPSFAPDLPGVTDQASIDDWDLPFELVETIRDEDEEYWDKYRTTPKAFVSHALAARLWSTRWGTDSVLRLPAVSRSTELDMVRTLREQLNPRDLGMSLVNVRHDALAAASGTTPFDGLFLGFSMFLMASAVMLTSLLFRLGIEQRAREAGLLLAVGAAVNRLRRLWMIEAAFVSLLGAVIGVAGGIAYARLMVYGLNTWWIAATAEPFMQLHVTWRSLLVGSISGLLVAMLTIAWSLRRFAHLPARQLLSGDAQLALPTRRTSHWSHTVLPLACIFAAIALGIAARRWEGEAQAGAFFGSGVLALTGILLAVRGRLRGLSNRPPSSLSLAGLAARNARRNPSRTMLSLTLAATASFLIVAMSAFRLAPSDRGVGGFDLLATADLPLLYDLSTEAGRRELGFSAKDEQQLADCEIIPLRMREGEDASCLNLYKPSEPRILGAPPQLATASQFAWAASQQSSPDVNVEDFGDDPAPPDLQRKLSGWSLLYLPSGQDENYQSVIPMIVDRNTAAYSLKIGLGDRLQIPISDAFWGANFEVVGLLANSVLQGDVIISEENFLKAFPEEPGWRYFLIRNGAQTTTDELAQLLETRLEDFGFDAVDSRMRLGELLAVQNTYLSTFQTLGALGLLLGVVGLAVVQLRSVLERRGELALLQAAGFRRGRLAAMVLAENLVLLIGGLAIGSCAALAAVVPHAAIQQVGTPWGTLALLLTVVAAAGAAAAWLASRSVLRAPLLPALRGD